MNEDHRLSPESRFNRTAGAGNLSFPMAGNCFIENLANQVSSAIPVEHGPASAVGLEAAGAVLGHLYSKRPGQNKARF
jgi:hypothetical protein